MLNALSVGAASGNRSVRQAAQLIVKAAAKGRGRIGGLGVAATARPALLSTDEPCVILTHPGDVCGQLLAALARSFTAAAAVCRWNVGID
jgi:hypothetical protein